MNDILHFTKRLYRFAGKRLIISVLGMVFVSLLEGTGILLLLPMMSISGIANGNVGTSSLSGALKVIQELPQSLGLSLILCLYVVLVLGQSLLQRVLNIEDAKIQQNFVRQLRLETYRSLFQSDWPFFVKRRKSDLVNLMTTELTRVGFGTTIVLQLLAAFIFTGIQIGLAFWLSAGMTSFVLLSGIGLVLLTRKYIRRSNSIGNQTSQLSQTFLAGVTDQLSGMKDIKSHMLEESRLAWFRGLTAQMVQEQTEYIRIRTGSQLLYKSSSAVLIAGFVFLSLKLFHSTGAGLLLIFVIFSRIWPRFTSIQTNMENLASALPAFKAIKKLLDECRSTVEFQIEDIQNVKPVQVHREIECKGVFFRYNSDEPNYALQDISFQVPVNRTTAVIGRSGAGKSTLIDILMGLMVPEKGQVLIDGVPLTKENRLAMRRSISYVPQDPFLFNGTIRENLLMVAPNAVEEQLWEALEFAASAEFVRKLPHGLDTFIGDRGIRLSGGERQRLVLARAVLRKPSILILDEATSALDTENEAKIQEALDRLKGKLTMIVIAHRLTTIRNADQVIMLDQGKLIRKGGAELIPQPAVG